MSFLDVFAWIVLIVMLASTVAVICVAGWLPGHIAKTRNHPWAQRRSQRVQKSDGIARARRANHQGLSGL
jgi:Protein of unknown function (DUF3302)